MIGLVQTTPPTESAPQIARITAAYGAAHYGQVPDSREALREIKAAWGHVPRAPVAVHRSTVLGRPARRRTAMANPVDQREPERV